jgi:hypothetical protein
MRDLIKSVNSYFWAMSLFGIKQMENMMSTGNRGEDRNPATKAMDDITDATRKQIGTTLDSIFRTGDALQRWTTDAALFVMFPLLLMMGRSSASQSASEEMDESADRRQQMTDEQEGATPISNSRKATGGRKR